MAVGIFGWASLIFGKTSSLPTLGIPRPSLNSPYSFSKTTNSYILHFQWCSSLRSCYRAAVETEFWINSASIQTQFWNCNLHQYPGRLIVSLSLHSSFAGLGLINIFQREARMKIFNGTGIQHIFWMVNGILLFNLSGNWEFRLIYFNWEMGLIVFSWNGIFLRGLGNGIYFHRELDHQDPPFPPLFYWCTLLIIITTVFCHMCHYEAA